jgi:Ankyrin repeats (3 copies)
MGILGRLFGTTSPGGTSVDMALPTHSSSEAQAFIAKRHVCPSCRKTGNQQTSGQATLVRKRLNEKGRVFEVYQVRCKCGGSSILWADVTTWASQHMREKAENCAPDGNFRFISGSGEVPEVAQTCMPDHDDLRVHNPSSRFDIYSAALFTAAREGDSERVRAVLLYGRKGGVKKRDGSPALLLAVQIGNSHVVQTLLDHSVDANARNMEGVTALILAAQNGHTEVVQSLLAHGAQVNATAKDGGDALMAAVFGGHTETVKALLAAGAEAKL